MTALKALTARSDLKDVQRSSPINLGYRVVVFNSVLFQGVWWIAVQGSNVMALLALGAYFLLHLSLFPRSGLFWTFCFTGALAGWFIDSILATAGLISYASSLSFSVQGVTLVLAPAWLLCIWLAFLPMLFFGLRWLVPFPRAAAVFGFVFAPLSYIGGARFAGAELGVAVETYFLTMGTLWALLLPLLLVVCGRLSVCCFPESQVKPSPAEEIQS